MKKCTILLAVLFICFYSINAQNIQFPPSVLSAGGGTIINNKPHISKWRIGKVNIYYIKSEDLKNANISSVSENNKVEYSYEIKAYPNPVTDYLYLNFNMEEPSLYLIDVFDILGEKLITNEEKLILSRQTIQLDFNGIASGFYLVNIRNSDFSVNKNFKISKQ